MIQVKVLLARINCLSRQLVAVAAQREEVRAETRAGARHVQQKDERGRRDVRSSMLAAARIDSAFHPHDSADDVLVLEPKYRVGVMQHHVVSVAPFSSIRRPS